MIEQPIQTVKLGSIEQPIFDFTVVSKADVNRMATSDGALPFAKLALVKGKMYPVGGFASISAAHVRGDESVECHVTNYDSKKDAVKAGLREHSVSEPINTLKISELCEYLGGDTADIMTECNMNGTFFERVSHVHITPAVREKCEEVVDRLSEKLPAQMLVVPSHILTGLGKANAKKQMAVFNNIYELIEFESPESQFNWPTQAQVSLAVRVTNVVEDDEAIIIHPQNYATESDEVSGSTDEGVEYEKEEEMPASLQLAKQSKNCLVIPEKDGSHKIVDLKAKTVSEVGMTDDKLNFKSQFIESENAVIMSPSAVKHLDLANKETREQNFDSPTDAIKHLKQLEKSAKVSLFWTI